jgi:hypothetical protein
MLWWPSRWPRKVCRRGAYQARKLRRDQTFAELAGGALQLHAGAAEAVVNLQPETGQAGEIDVIWPGLARVALEDEAEFCRPAGAAVQIEIGDDVEIYGGHGAHLGRKQCGCHSAASLSRADRG